MCRITKTQEALELYKEGDIKASLKIFKTFKLGLSKDEQRSLQIAYECLSGKKEFYNMIGIDINKELKTAENIIKDYKI